MKNIDLPEIVEKGLSTGVGTIFFFRDFQSSKTKAESSRSGDSDLKDIEARSILRSTKTIPYINAMEQNLNELFGKNNDKMGRTRTV